MTRLAIGSALTIRGPIFDKTFFVKAATPYTNRHGYETTILTWASSCVKCGRPFDVTSGPGRQSARLALTKTQRCKAHRGNGKR